MLVLLVHGCLGFCIVLICNYVQFCQYQSSDWLGRLGVLH